MWVPKSYLPRRRRGVLAHFSGLSDGRGSGRTDPDPLPLSFSRRNRKSDNWKEVISLGRPQGASDRPRNPRNDYSAYDRALIKAKESGREVDFTLATGEVLTECAVCSVDKFQVEVEHSAQGPMRGEYARTKEWLNKALIARTRIR